MIEETNMADYKTSFFPEVIEFIKNLPEKHRDKVNNLIQLLEKNSGRLDEPLSRYLGGGIRELRPDFGRTRYRILFALAPNKIILLLTAFLKKTQKTPKGILDKATKRYKEYLKKPRK